MRPGLDLIQETFNQDYLTRLKNGEPETERHFVRHFSSVMRLKLRGMVRSPQVAEDVCQETFLRLFRMLKSEKNLDNPERLAAFVHSVCKNVALEHLRAIGRHPQLPENTPDPADYGFDFDSRLVNEERKRVIRRVLDELNARDRDILRMIYLEEQDKSRVCSHFQVKPDHLRLLLYRAKTRFRRILEQGKSVTSETSAGSGSQNQRGIQKWTTPRPNKAEP